MPTSGGVVVPRVPTSGGLAGPRAPTSGKCAMQFFSSPCVFLNTSPANVGSLHLGRIPNCSEVPDIDVCRRVPTSGRGVVPRVPTSGGRLRSRAPTCGLPHTNTTSGLDDSTLTQSHIFCCVFVFNPRTPLSSSLFSIFWEWWVGKCHGCPCVRSVFRSATQFAFLNYTLLIPMMRSYNLPPQGGAYMPSQGYQYAPTGPQGLSGYHGSLGLPRSPMPQGYQTYGGWAPQGYPVNQGPPRSAGVPLQGFPPQMQGPGVQFGGRPQQSFAPAAQAYPPQQWPTRGTMTPAGQPAAPAAAASTTSSPAAQSLAGGVDKLCSDEDISRAFANTLQMIAPEVLPSLRPDASGCLRVASPFCGGFVEAGPIHEFLKTSVLSIPQIQRIHVDVHDIQHTADSSIESLGPQTTITYEARNLDLLKEKMPPVCLTLGVHPQITGNFIV